MPGWNEVTKLSDCLPVQRRVPQLVYTNKIGDCLFIYYLLGKGGYVFGSVG